MRVERPDIYMAPSTSPDAPGWRGVIRDPSMQLAENCHREKKPRRGNSPVLTSYCQRRGNGRKQVWPDFPDWWNRRSQRIRTPL